MRDSVDPHISYSVHFSEWEAAIAAGATLDELLHLEEYPKKFRAKVMAWFGYHKLVELHAQDASMSKTRKGKH